MSARNRFYFAGNYLLTAGISLFFHQPHQPPGRIGTVDANQVIVSAQAARPDPEIAVR